MNYSQILLVIVVSVLALVACRPSEHDHVVGSDDHVRTDPVMRCLREKRRNPDIVCDIKSLLHGARKEMVRRHAFTTDDILFSH